MSEIECSVWLNVSPAPDGGLKCHTPLFPIPARQDLYFDEEDEKIFGCHYPPEEEKLEAMLLGLSPLIGLLHDEETGGAREQPPRPNSTRSRIYWLGR